MPGSGRLAGVPGGAQQSPLSSAVLCNMVDCTGVVSSTLPRNSRLALTDLDLSSVPARHLWRACLVRCHGSPHYVSLALLVSVR